MSYKVHDIIKLPEMARALNKRLFFHGFLCCGLVHKRQPKPKGVAREEKKMAEKKKSEAKKKKAVVIYNGREYSVLEEVNGRLKLTDGVIHFWVKADKVERD